MNRYKMAILMPVNSQDLMKILKGEKTLIVSKFMPNCAFPMDVYLYCTKSGLNLYSECVEVWHYFDMGVAEPFGEFTNFNLTKDKLEVNKIIRTGQLSRLFRKRLNGKVVAKFTLNSVDKIVYYDEQEPEVIYNEDLGVNELDYSKCETGYCVNQLDLNKMCLTYDELEKYGKGKKYIRYKLII